MMIAVVSGKGGTGKTTLTAALAALAPSPVVMADCNLESSNLALLLPTGTVSKRPLTGRPCAVIDTDTCVECLSCVEHCAFGAISYRAGRFVVSPVACEGCGLCTRVCPASAPRMEPWFVGDLCLAETPYGLLSHARLLPGYSTNGFLVAEVKRQAREAAGEEPLLLVDGPPGTGGALLAAVAGADLILVVTEPSAAGIRDLERVVAACRDVGGVIGVVIGRAGQDLKKTDDIRRFCRDEGIDVFGEVPIDGAVLAQIRTLTTSVSPGARAYRQIWDCIERYCAKSP